MINIKKRRRMKLGFLGMVLVLIGLFSVVNYNILVPQNIVKEVSATENGSTGTQWNVTGKFDAGDIICGLVLEPTYREPGWLDILEPMVLNHPRYGKILYPNIAVYLELYYEDGLLISKIEMIWINDPNAKPPVNLHLYIYNMTYLPENSSLSSYFPVEAVTGTSWIVLTPEGVKDSGNYTLKVSAFGAMPAPTDQPPSRIALGERLVGYPYWFLLPVGLCIIILGVTVMVIVLFPRIIEKSKNRMQ